MKLNSNSSVPLVLRNNIDNDVGSIKLCCVKCVLEDMVKRNAELIEDIKRNPDKYRFFRKAPQYVRMKLVKLLGQIRESKIEQWLADAYPEDEGYNIIHYVNNQREPDFIVFKDNVPFMAVEVKNLGEDSFMLQSTFDNVVKKLCKYPCFKLLILSSGKNLITKTKQTHNNKTYTYYNTKLRNTSEFLRSKGIYTWILGYQDLMTMDQFNELVIWVLEKRLQQLEKIGIEKGWLKEKEVKGWIE
ncbi:MAG: hypothetical protein QW222_04315 [Candidatus Bathyarchaeia archaeon]